MESGNIDFQYQVIIKKCKFISKKDEWFLEGTEAKIDRGGSYIVYKEGDKFNRGSGLFYGVEAYPGLPGEDGELCSFDEFFICDEFDNEISELTLEEYKVLLRKNKLEKLM